MSKPLPIHHFTDILCIWAYACQIRVDELLEREGDAIALDRRFCSVFGEARDRLARSWEDRGGLKGYQPVEELARALRARMHTP